MKRRLLYIGPGLLALLLMGAAGANFWVAGFVYEDLPPPPLPPMEPIAGSLSSATCGECHTQLHRAWKASAHGRAHVNPMYLADFRHQDEPYVCEYCHTPLVEQRDEVVTGLWMAWPAFIPRASANPRYDDTLRVDGVGCVACHQRDGAMVGPFDAQGAPHPTRKVAMTQDVCRPCHTLDLTVNSKLVRPIQDTFGEWEEYRRKGGEKGCIDCHMPRVAPAILAPGGPPRLGRDHRLKGPRDVAFLKTGVVIRSVKFDRRGEARVTVFNGTGHRLPTAEPQRRLEIRLEALGATGERLTMASANVQRVIPLPEMVDVSDTTLKPMEERELIVKVPIAGASKLRASVIFHLWDPTDRVAVEARVREEDLRILLWTDDFKLK